MPFDFAWIVAVVGGILALFVWAKTKRFGPAAAVFGGGILIIVLTDPSMLGTLADALRGLIEEALDEGLSN